MYRDPRGGHNQKNFNEGFFKLWSHPMSYVLGYIAADGSLLDARKSSRTCYTQIASNDREILEQIKKTLNSSHNIYYKPPHTNTFRGGKKYLCKESYNLRFGSKLMFQDILNPGITPRKS